jgi:sulfite reductase (NADPH) hemoprotein beta-component
MYRYDAHDDAHVRARVAQFRGQIARRLSGALTEEEFKPLRLMNGLYLQLHAYMLRVAIPYGTLDSAQMRVLAEIAERWDRGYGHFTTRQNIQFNWVRLRDTADILDRLADAGMHAIQTSGNCIRNVTADHFAGAAADEIEDPRPTAELIRHWSTDHPEFAFLPRKFKIALSGAADDRAVTMAHDIGLRLKHDATGAPGYAVIVGGGLGRTPMIGKALADFVPRAQLLGYLEAILRVYNLHGRRDNKYKARIKILVHEIGVEAMRAEVDAEHGRILAEGGGRIPPGEYERIAAHFAPPRLAPKPAHSMGLERAMSRDAALRGWVEANTTPHRQAGHALVTVSLKTPGEAPGDASAAQMRALADFAALYSQGELRVSHAQNVILPHVALDDLPALWRGLRLYGLASANAGLISDIIACPGLDFCALATARSIPIAQDIALRFAAPERAQAIGQFQIKISGCINACGHHHVGHVGILGLEKAGRESYQITLGGDAGANARLGERAGPGLSAEEVGPAVERLVDAYLTLRAGPSEPFVDSYRRLGPDPFRAAIYLGETRDAA